MPIDNQHYEQYWSLTLAYSDIYEERFNSVLAAIVSFIDNNRIQETGMSSAQYIALQKRIHSLYPIGEASIRKAINQFYKLGFINNQSKGYHNLTKKFLSETSKEAKKVFYSKILYENASFNRSYSNISKQNEISFILKTLENVNELSEDDMACLMQLDISHYSIGCLQNRKQLDNIKSTFDINGFKQRKYNQIGYIFRTLSHLSEIKIQNKKIYLITSKYTVLEEEETRKTRDPYLQRLYKLQLTNEMVSIFGKPVCALENLSYPVLIASHIKPYKDSNEDEAFDPENGILLSKNMDSLFDLGYITFALDGSVVCTSVLDNDLIAHLKKYSLPKIIMTEKRKAYLEYHNSNVFKKMQTK